MGVLLLFEHTVGRERGRERHRGQGLAASQRRPRVLLEQPLGGLVVRRVVVVVELALERQAGRQARARVRQVVRRQVRQAPALVLVAPPVLGQQPRAGRPRVVQREGGGGRVVRGRRGLRARGGVGAVLVRLQRRPVRALGVRGAAALLEAVRALQLARRVQHDLDAVRALVVDAAAAHRLRELVQHRPRHAGQVAQVAVLPFLHDRHLAAGCRAGRERSVLFVPFKNCHDTI